MRRDGRGARRAGDTIYDELAALKPPRKHYQRYYSTREANENMWHRAAGDPRLPARLLPHEERRLEAEPARFRSRREPPSEWAKLPRYYVMDLDKGMAETVAAEMPSAAEIAACRWLPDEELQACTAANTGRTGFQGGLQGYRVGSSGRFTAELQTFSGRTIDVPSMFIGGKSDWGVYQNPGALERMQKTVVHADAGDASGGRRRTLGAAGTARGGEQAARRLSEGDARG